MNLAIEVILDESQLLEGEKRIQTLEENHCWYLLYS
jgi:hypothetical protein